MKKLATILLLLLAFLIYNKVRAPAQPALVEVPVAEKQTVTLNFVGDILAARTVETTMRRSGYGYPFVYIHEELKDADITFANLETPLIGNASTGKTTPGGMTTFRGDVDFAQALKDAGIDIVSLANNHMKDQGTAGIQETVKALDAAGVVHAGAGMNLSEARALKIIETNGVKVGFLAYTDNDVIPEMYFAKANQSGSNIMNVDNLKTDIMNARPLVDILVVSMHSGHEYVTKNPNSRQTTFARAAIDTGADMVVGHHPHVLQPIEIYKGKYIFYSLGNFVFDQIVPDTRESVLVKMGITLTRTGEEKWKIDTFKPTILPLVIQSFQPRKTEDSVKKQQILSKLSSSTHVFSVNNQNLFVEVADTPETLQRGLSGRTKLDSNKGLLFVFEGAGKHGIWMKDMLFPIDIYWFDEDFKLVDKQLSVSPDTFPNVFYPDLNARYVLETGVGTLSDMSLTRDLTGELTLLESYDKR